MSAESRVLVLGAAGRDFHDFNVVLRDDPSLRVVAFTAAQIPGVGGRRYPASLAGPRYPDGIPIREEAELEALCRERRIDRVILAYSDLSHAEVMHLASRALAAGADFELVGPRRSMLPSTRPVVAVSAVRTGCGKSQVARWVADRLREHGVRVAALRHPMPYGDLERQRVQRFAEPADLDREECTAEEREEYRPWIEAGGVVFSGVDTAAALAAAEPEAEVLVWDGGNNDWPFVRPDLHLVVADALRPEQVASHHPGETVARMADVLVVNKVDAGSAEDVAALEARLRAVNGRAPLVRLRSPTRLDDPSRVRGRRVLVVDDGPTLTHGGMSYGAGFVAAVQAGAAEIVDPRPSATPGLREVFERHPHLDRVLPAVGYGEEQRAELRETIEKSDADVVVCGSPVDLAALLDLTRPVVRARYDVEEVGSPALGELVDAFLHQRGVACAS